MSESKNLKKQVEKINVELRGYPIDRVNRSLFNVTLEADGGLKLYLFGYPVTTLRGVEPCRKNTRYTPEQMRDAVVPVQQQHQQKAYFQERAKTRQKPAATTNQDRLRWVVGHYGIRLTKRA